MARTWSQTLGVGLLAATTLCGVGAAHALTLGPAVDFYRSVSASDPSALYATAWAPPLPGTQQVALRGQVQITLEPGADQVPVIGIGYLSAASGRFDTGNLTFTSVFGTAASAPKVPYPGIGDEWDPPPVNGCCGTSGGSDALRFSAGPYTLVGASGTVYLSRPVRQVTLSELPTVLGSEFDLSSISGDPAEVLYLFQTDLPASELLSPVPEPGSALLLLAGLGLLVRRPGLRRPGAPATV